MILVIAEQKDGAINRASWEAVAAAQTLGGPIRIAVIGSGATAAIGEMAGAKVEAVLAVDHAALASYTADAYTHAIAELVTAQAPDVVVAAHTYQARDVMPRVAARLDRPLVTDVVGIQAGSPPVCVRPMFQAKLVAEVVPVGPAPHFVTVQIGAFRADSAARGDSPAPVTAVDVTMPADAIRQKPEPPFREAKQAVDLTQAPRIVSVGRGIKGEEHIQLARDLAASLGAELAASRPVIDSGWVPKARQIGKSGATVHPKLYLGLGVSGAPEHVEGMQGAELIVAINTDPGAAIFNVAHYGAVADLFDVADELTTLLA